jgi:hypothetical protein
MPNALLRTQGVVVVYHVAAFGGGLDASLRCSRAGCAALKIA